MKPLCVALIVAAVGIVEANGQSTQPALVPAAAVSVEMNRQVEGWIEQLSHDNWAQRQQAKDELIKLGDAAVPRVKRLLTESKNPDLLASAETILAEIERLQRDGPTLLTLHFDNASAREVLDAIVQQAGHPIPIWPDHREDQLQRQRLTIHADRQPFWNVMREFCQKANLSLQDIGADRRLTLTPGGDDRLAGPVQISGPFMVIAQSTNDSRSRALARPELLNRSRGMQIAFYAEPKLAIVSRSWHPVIETLVGQDGTEYPVARPGDQEHSGDNDWMWNTSLTLPPDEKLTTIARLKGYLPITVETRVETAELDIATAQGKELALDAFRMQVKEVKVEERSVKLQLAITISETAPDIRQINRINHIVNNISLLDAQGIPLQRGGYGGGGGNNTYNYEVSYSYGHKIDNKTAGKPAKLIWRMPVEFQEMKIPFEFTDIPLP